MKIKNLQLKKINITALFDKIDQSLITSEAIRDLFDLKAPERANTPFIELPGTKVLIIPTLKKEVVIEPNRLRVSDASIEDPAKSKIISDFEKAYKAFSGKSTLRAYGYNYDISLQLQDDNEYHMHNGMLSLPSKKESCILFKNIDTTASCGEFSS